MKVQEIVFQGEDYILTEHEADNSPICTKDQFRKFECSYAHLYRTTGTISRFGETIGVIGDITFGEVVELDIEPNISSMVDELLGGSGLFRIDIYK